ncbi:hypothetical protein [Phenylobacterium sp.]|uniref:hypothetical protein n=1 Tax=Phenylobacterium sp. TaxID=1871053 RepID=UPI0037C88A7B
MAAACTTVRSTPVSHGPHVGASQGVTYYLPMRPMKLTATRSPIDLTEMKKALPGKQATLAEAKKGFGAAEAARKQAEAVEAALAADAAAAKAAAAVKTSIAKADEAVAKRGVDAAEKALNELSAAITVAQISGAECTYEAKLELLPPQPDIRHRYIARIVHNPFRDDTFSLKVTPAGLLSSTNVVAADRTADIIVEAAGALAGVGGFGGPGAPMAPNAANPPVPCAKLPKTLIRIFDPTSTADGGSSYQPIERRVAPRQSKVDDAADTFEPQLEDGPPAQPSADIVRAAGEVEDTNQELRNAKFPFRIKVVLPSVGAAGPVARGDTYGAVAQGALFYRSPTPVMIRLEQEAIPGCASDSCWQPIDMAFVALPQAGPTSFIPMNSSAFVKTVNDVQFTDGAIVNWTAERPSEFLEIVRLPVKIATAVISVPAQLISLKVDYSTKDKSLIEAQRQQIKALDNWRRLQDCRTAAGADNEAVAACFE